MKSKCFSFLVLALLLITSARADWQEPRDNKFTEDQLKTYIETSADWFGQMQQITATVQAAQTPEAKMAALGDLDKKESDCLDKHHISKAEFNWLSDHVLSAYNFVTFGDAMISKTNAQIQDRVKDNDQKAADANKRLAAFQSATKSGHRVLSDDDRAAAINAAKEDQKSAADDVKQQTDDVKSADTDATQHEADAKAAEALAANPPADVMADDRADYIQRKKDYAKTSREAAKEAQDRAAEARKALLEAQQRADISSKRIDHPEIPLTDDEKSAVKSDNEAGLAQAQQEIDSCQKSSLLLTQAQTQVAQSQIEMKKNIPDENIALIRKHQPEIKAVVDKIYNSSAATKPAN